MNSPALLETAETFLREHDLRFERDDDNNALVLGLDCDGVRWRICVTEEDEPETLEVVAHSCVRVAPAHRAATGRLINLLNQATRFGYFLLAGEEHDMVALRYTIPLLPAHSAAEVVEFTMDVVFRSIVRTAAPLATFARTGGAVGRTLKTILEPETTALDEDADDSPRLVLESDGLISGGPQNAPHGLN